ncbi:leukemia NUP98 fusion partner 1 [Alligator mississippiensis]|uniref:Leukemia NUP98 fusion partner 1 n=1 Tax=Alligator mississippiensis TaxID=8496 RepID=A0A151MCX7_ALLMI|nr:leukemia NUP98 fusion partner 1 [Alligator mississippiensis]XP_014459400.1 leukemia NUP98 fusion partner 1 [Alligator mississippiensis]XP_019331625.1 leukemia NUP98 fusion partner 1 [Alligator mississippiensis]XP_019331626.1 leukemia NUP98 fusion partner 1 [Alligator mississippiensis]XP_019331628.1 leukemia NUP98 fusion partner 1 [Alligator mississippiensis]KYO22339.1 leukemia NUP98 fusion partner 1 [Alligator mississippiensis]
MEDEEDDDVSFAKWMSSYWGHSLIDEHEKEGRGFRQRQSRVFSERRASLPAKLSSIHMTRLRESTKAPSSSHLRGCKEVREDQDMKCHCHVKECRMPSMEGPCPETREPHSRTNSIQELSESFKKQLHFKSKRSISLPPEGMMERTERERLGIPKSRSRKKMGERMEPKRGKEEESPQASGGKHN